MSKCRSCGIELYWRDMPDEVTGKKVPYENPQFTRRHECPNYKPHAEPQKSLVEPLSDDEILWIRNFRATLRMVKK